jgi:outer membrane protein assembly factor BamB
MMTKKLSTFLLGVFAATAVQADNWPQWRGPNANGFVEAGDYPTEFSPEKNMAWKTPLSGTGSSTPAVWGERIFVTAPVDGKDGVFCYNLSDGKEAWKMAFADERKGKHANGTGSNPSPVTDGERVYCYYKSGTVAALDMDGKKVWSFNLHEKYGDDTLWWDLGTSPVLVDGMLVIAAMHEGPSYVVALDAKTGAEKWKVDRTFKVQKENDQSYSTPLVVDGEHGKQLVIWGADHVTGHSVSNGKEIWRCGGFNPDDKAMWRMIASPATDGKMVVVPYGRAGYFAGIKIGGMGDVTETARVWEHDDRGADVPTPIVHDGKTILIGDKGEIWCHDLKDGKEIWNAKLPKDRAKYYASPTLVGDILVCVREDGAVMVGKVKADGFELMSENAFEEKIIASPVFVNDMILIRGAENLYCLKK